MWDFTNDVVQSNLVPDGDYSVQVEKTEMKKTKDGTGEYLSVQFNILGPTQLGRKLFTTFNLKNKNDKAVTIGRGQLKQMLIASSADITNASPEAMLNLTLDVKVGNKTDDFGEKNTIKKFSRCTLNSVPKSSKTVSEDIHF